MSSGSNTKPFEAARSKLSKTNSVGHDSPVADANTDPSKSSLERMFDAKLATLATIDQRVRGEHHHPSGEFMRSSSTRPVF